MLCNICVVVEDEAHFILDCKKKLEKTCYSCLKAKFNVFIYFSKEQNLLFSKIPL